MRKPQLYHTYFIIIFFQFPIEDCKTLYRIEVGIYTKQRRSLPISNALFISRHSSWKVLHFFKRNTFVLKTHRNRERLVKFAIFLTKANNTLLRFLYHLVIKSHFCIKQHKQLIY